MTNEEKQLLLKDLCARLPYKIRLKYYKDNENGTLVAINFNFKNVWIMSCNGSLDSLMLDDIGEGIWQIKPYLRPMSSMTEEEARIIFELYGYKTKDILQVKITDEYLEAKIDDGCCSFERYVIWYDEIVNSTQVFDWLNAHYFDYRGLIEKDLAIESPEGMYNTKTNSNE